MKNTRYKGILIIRRVKHGVRDKYVILLDK